MKKIRIAALAVAACGLMVACNNNAPAELVDTVVAIDTTVVDSSTPCPWLTPPWWNSPL